MSFTPDDIEVDYHVIELLKAILIEIRVTNAILKEVHDLDINEDDLDQEVM